MRQASRERSGAEIAGQLRERSSEIEQAILTRVYAVSEPPVTGGPEYTEGLRAAVCAAIGYGIEGIEWGERSAPPLPDALLSQARLAARSGVSLDTVLRRYFAGYTLLEDFIVQEAERELDSAVLKRLLRSQAAIVDRLLAAVSKAYAEEAERKPRSSGQKTEQVERLLAGELLDASELGYGLEGYHLGIVASGPGAQEVVEALAMRLDCRLLSIPRQEGILWAWLGSRRRLDLGELQAETSRELAAGLFLAVGEPGEGLSGWRFTHRQARAALSVALRGGERLARYADVALLASVTQDELLVASLRSLYLQPLAEERDSGAALRETLRAYFATGRNISSAAATLNVDRRTVSNRLRAVEEYIGRPLDSYAIDIQLALRIEGDT